MVLLHQFENKVSILIRLVKGAYKKTNQPHISYAIVRP
jgi:hypothetical protein